MINCDMGISIITPHFNDFRGLKQIHHCLLKQDSKDWEWIIVDDCSGTHTKESIITYFKTDGNPNIKLILNENKTTGSICRNIGVNHSKYNHLVFLDADDIILEDFVSNRIIEVEDFVVFKNFNHIDKNGNTKRAPSADANYLNHFLSANFIWQTTCVLWHKEFLIKIGKFNTHLKRLQDIELSIRALVLSSSYKVIDNKVDFFYNVVPIDIKKKPIAVICESVDYLIKYMYDNYKFDKHQRALVTAYYYLCVRYYNRSDNKGDIVYIRKSLSLFYKKNYMPYLSYSRALLFLNLRKMNLISSDLFLRLNRYFYK